MCVFLSTKTLYFLKINTTGKVRTFLRCEDILAGGHNFHGLFKGKDFKGYWGLLLLSGYS